jgi:serine protease Do
MKKMTTKQHLQGLLAVGMVAAIGSATLLSPAQDLKVKVENEPIDREGPLPASYASVVETVSPSVVHIFTSRNAVPNNQLRGLFNHPLLRQYLDQLPEQREGLQPSGLGSGVIVTPDGYILTNNHVVEDVDEIKVMLPGSSTKQEYIAELVGADAETDVAVLKIDADNLPAITLGDSRQLMVGDRVFAIGNPFDVGQTVTSGIISGLGRSDMGIVQYENFIQTDAAINMGNSGGALVDIKGRLIGVNTAILSRSGGNNGIGLAIPVNIAVNVMQELVTDGEVSRGYLGVGIADVTQDLADFYNMTQRYGALIKNVEPGSPADEAGIRAGDVIVQVQQNRVNSARHLKSLVGQLPPGTEAQVALNRQGDMEKLSVKLGELNQEMIRGFQQRWQQPSRSPRQNRPDDFENNESPLAGLQLQDAAGSTMANDLPDEMEGVVIEKLHPDSPAAQKQLREGDVILEINHKPVSSVDQAQKIANSAPEGKILVRIWRDGDYEFKVIEAPEVNDEE